MADIPQNVIATQETSPIVISWDALEGGSDRYFMVQKTPSSDPGTFYDVSGWMNGPLPYGYEYLTSWNDTSTLFGYHENQGGIRWTYRVISKLTSTGEISDPSNEAIGWIIPAAPEGLVVWSSSSTPPSIVLNWYDFLDNASLDYDLIYKVERSSTIVVTWDVLYEGRKQNPGLNISYTDNTVEMGVAYLYRISARVNVEGTTYGDLSSEISHTIALPAPQNLVVSQGTHLTQIDLSWDAVISDNLYYIVERADTINGTYVGISSDITDIFFNDQSLDENETKFYRVVAHVTNQITVDSVPSNVVSGKTNKTLEWSSASSTYTNKIDLAWELYPGNQYKITRSSTENESVPYPTVIMDWTEIGTFEDTNLNSATLYYYYIEEKLPISGDIVTGDPSGLSGVTIPETPQNVTISQGVYINKIDLSWDAVYGVSISYYVFRSDTIDGAYVIINNELYGQPGLSYSDTSVFEGKQYYYKVMPLSWGTYWCSDPTPVSGYTKLSTPSSVAVSQGDYLNNVNVSWDAITTSAGIVSYQVHRSLTSTGLYSATSGWVTSTGYNDTLVSPATYYYYKVIAKISQVTSDFSSVASGYTTSPIPSGFGAALGQGVSMNEIRIKWQPVLVEGVTYRLHRCNTSTGSYIPITDWISETEYNDKPVAENTMYFYKVQSKI